MPENPVGKWGTCKNSCGFGLFANDEAGHALAEEGYNENYGCEHPTIVNSGLYKTQEFMERDGSFTRAAILHGIGKDEDLSVINALKKSCRNCPFYEYKHYLTT